MTYTLEKLRQIGMPVAMTALVEAADEHGTFTYKDIAERIQIKLRSTIASEHIGFVVGSMMDEIYRVAPAAPPLNALCVNGTTKLPGDGAHDYIKWYNPKIDYKNLDASKKREVLLPVYEDIYKYRRWPQVARRAFDIAIDRQPLQRRKGEHEGKARRLGYGGPAESDEHRRLKEYVGRNPKLFGAPKGCKNGVLEKLLKSMDEIDVWFVSPGEQLAIEVKSRRSTDLDLQRGVFQCVKYRALLEAENKIKKIESEVRACLVLERELPAELHRLAKLFDVEVRIASLP